MDDKISFELFSIQAPARTGLHWACKASESIGYVRSDKTPQFNVGIVRHPYDWLRSIFYAQLPVRYYTNTVLNQIVHFAAISLTLPEFIDRMISVPGKVTTVFDHYQVDSVVRLEDFPWAMVEFFQSLPHDSSLTITSKLKAIEPTNVGIYRHPDAMWFASERQLKTKIIRGEKEFCERYDYF